MLSAHFFRALPRTLVSCLARYGAFTWNNRRVRLILGGDALCTFHSATVQKISASTTTEYVRSDGIKWTIYTKQTAGFLGDGGYWLLYLDYRQSQQLADTGFLQVTSMANIHNHADSQAWTKPWDTVAPRRAAARQPCG